MGWTGLEKLHSLNYGMFFEWIPFSLSTPSPDPNNPILLLVRQFGAFFLLFLVFCAFLLFFVVFCDFGDFVL